MPRPAPRGRPRAGELRPDRRNPSLDHTAVRRQLAHEVPSLPRELAQHADPLTLSFLVARLLDPPHPDPTGPTDGDDAPPDTR